ncbi:MAG: hypothetical protein AAFV43_06185 [Planctomycetota bacterium]
MPLQRLSSAFLLCVLLLSAVVLSAVPAAAQQAPPAPAGDDAMVDSPWFKVGWPKIEMPKVDWKPWGGGESQPKGSSGNGIADTLERVSDATGGAARNLREGWGSLLSKLPFGPGSPPPGSTASRNEPGFWSRMFGSPDPRGSQTVTEFLAQEQGSAVK